MCITVTNPRGQWKSGEREILRSLPGVDLKAGLVPLAELLALVQAKPPELNLVLTGRGAPPELVDVADLVSEIQPVKHPFQQGIKAQRGIEF